MSTYMDWYFQCWRKYADFNGRARRRGYWYWILFNAIFGSLFTLATGFFFGLIGLNVGSLSGANSSSAAGNAIGGGVVGALIGYFIGVAIWALITLIPGLAVGIRRLHDIGRSDWWIVLLPTILSLLSLPLASTPLIFFVALAQFGVSIWLIVLFCTDSQAGDNQWGAYPKSLATNAYATSNAAAHGFAETMSPDHFAPQARPQWATPLVPQTVPPTQPVPRSFHAVPEFCHTCGTASNGALICQTCGANSGSR